MTHKLTIAALAVLTTTVHAGAAAAQLPKPAERKLITWDVQDRVRWEIKDNVFDFDGIERTINDDNWVINRFRIGLGVQPTDWLKIYVQTQDSREWLSERPNEPDNFGSEGNDSFDLRQAYIELAMSQWGIKIGRQTLSYGDERLIGTADWRNFGNVFDAAKLTYKGHGWSIDAFAGSLVTPTRGQFNQSDAFNGNETHEEQVLSGLYFSTSAVGFADVDIYALHSHKSYDFIDFGTDFFTLGTRLKSKSAPTAPFPRDGKSFSCAVCMTPASPWDWDAEFAYQTGEVFGADLQAFAGHFGIGYTIPACPFNSRVGIEYNYASGDDNLFDNDVKTFQNLFPSNHKFYGFMDAFSWQNIHDVAVSWKAKPCSNVTTRIDYHAFWLADTNDFWYRSNGTSVVRPIGAIANQFINTDSYAGSELDVVVTWQARKELAIEAGYSHFFAGGYLGDTGVKDDADFGYVQATISF